MNIMRNNPRKAGFTLVEIMIVVVIVSLLAVITIPNFIRTRAKSQTSGCIDNLRQIDAAIQQWAMENNAGTATPVTRASISPYLNHGSNRSARSVYCPSDRAKTFNTSYRITDTSTKPLCHIASTTHSLD